MAATAAMGEDTAAIERTFTPEFRNRLDAVISFAPLPKSVILQVVEEFVLQLEAQLMDRNVTIELTKPAAEWLADKGYDDKMGARPLGRVIQEEIKKPLAEELFFGKPAGGGVVRVSIKDGKLLLETAGRTTRACRARSPSFDGGVIRSVFARSSRPPHLLWRTFALWGCHWTAFWAKPAVIEDYPDVDRRKKCPTTTAA